MVLHTFIWRFSDRIRNPVDPELFSRADFAQDNSICIWPSLIPSKPEWREYSNSGWQDYYHWKFGHPFCWLVHTTSDTTDKGNGISCNGEWEKTAIENAETSRFSSEVRPIPATERRNGKNKKASIPISTEKGGTRETKTDSTRTWWCCSN